MKELLIYALVRFTLQILIPIVYILVTIHCVLSDNNILFIIGLILPGFLPIIHNISRLGDDTE